MGSKRGARDERPVHKVSVSSFLIAKSEVTVEQYRTCVEAGVCAEPNAYDPDHEIKQYCDWGRIDRDDYPINCVSWFQLRTFAEWVGGRLPTEAEWKYAARAGSDADYYFGPTPEKLKSHACYAGNSRKRTDPVGKKRPNAWGLHDLSGNAWEWVGDWLGPYPPEDEIDPEGFPEGSKKVVRGGSVENHASYARISLRRLSAPDGSLSCLSFRLVRTNGPSLRTEPAEAP